MILINVYLLTVYYRPTVCIAHAYLYYVHVKSSGIVPLLK